MNCSTPGFPVLHYLLEFVQTHVHMSWMESVMPSNHLILCHPFPLLPSVFPNIRVISSEPAFTSGGQSIGASASVPVLPVDIQGWFPLGLTGLISAVQGTLKSLLQHHNSKASILHPSAFYMGQLSHLYMYICFSSSHLYMTTGKTIDLTILPLSAKWCLCFLACCLGLSLLFF